MNKSQEINEWANFDVEEIDLDTLEQSLQSDVEMNFSELEGLKEDFSKIGNPNTVVDVVKDVVWEQFLNQVAVVAGEDFIRENRGLTLDLRDSAHIQTVENFKNGKFATHNYKSIDKLEHNYDRYKNVRHKDFRKKYVDPGMDKTLTRAGQLKSQGVDTVRDIYTGRQIPTTSDNPEDKNLLAQREHVKPSAKIYEDSSLQMSYDDQELADIINDPENLQGYTTAQRNNRKSDKDPNVMQENDKNKHWEKANKRAEDFLDKKKKEGEERLNKEGRQTQREEFFRSSGKALRSVIMGLLASLLKQILQDLLVWFKSKTKSFKPFIDSIKDSIKNFFIDIKKHLITAAESFGTTLLTMILGPIVGMIKKAWVFLKQGWKSLKQAINFLIDPANKNKPFSIKILEVGKIVIAGFTAGGAIVLSEVIEKSLMTIPVFAFQIPLLGSLANILGIFFGAIVSGIIGAIALNLIDRLLAKKVKSENQLRQIKKGNEILKKQEILLAVTEVNLVKTKMNVAQDIIIRHDEFSSIIEMNTTEGEKLLKENNEINKNIDDLLRQF